MSTINASNFGDGTSSVPASAVLEGTAKAWLSMNAITTTSIRDSSNVSSITDAGSGDTIVNFMNAMASAEYALAGGTDVPHFVSFNATGAAATARAPASTDFQFQTRIVSSSPGVGDQSYSYVHVLGDLA